MNGTWFKSLASCGVVSAALFASPVFAKDISACLITKTDTNPYFVTMKEGAEQKANEMGVDLTTYAGTYDGDNQSQVAAIESCIAAGVDGILITPSDTKAIFPSISKARQADIMIVALDTKLQPASAADATFATDNVQAGKLIGEWARKRVDEENARIAFLDLAISQPTVGVQRDQGFMQGFGIDVKDPNQWGDESDPRIVGHDLSYGAEDRGRKAMENLLQKDSSINLVYTINEPAAAGAYQALEAAGLQDQATIVSIDGGCPGVKNVQEGIIGATAQQYPLLMASKGIEAVKAYVETGEKPQNSSGLDFINTGVNLVTDHPVEGLDSISIEEGLEHCWG